VTYVLAAAAACTVFVVAGWRGRSSRGLHAGNAWAGIPNDPLWAEDEIDMTAPDRQADVAGAIHAALRRLSPVLTQRPMKIEIAASPGLRVRMEAVVLTELILEALTIAIDRSPASGILVTGARHGDRVHIGITDDRAGANAASQSENLETLTGRVALLGGSLDIDVHSTEGTTMTLRLAMAVEPRPDAPHQPVPELAAEPEVASVHSL
jgi:hypothetical protein